MDNNYVMQMLQKYRVATAIAVLRSKPDDITVEDYISQLNNPTEISDMIIDEDFNLSDDEIDDDVLNNSITVLKDFHFNDVNHESSILDVVMGNLGHLGEAANETCKETSNPELSQATYFEEMQCDRININEDIEASDRETNELSNTQAGYLKSKVENNLNENTNTRRNTNNEYITDINIYDSQETEIYSLQGFTQSCTHISQSQDNVVVAQSHLVNDTGIYQIDDDVAKAKVLNNVIRECKNRLSNNLETDNNISNNSNTKAETCKEQNVSNFNIKTHSNLKDNAIHEIERSYESNITILKNQGIVIESNNKNKYYNSDSIDISKDNEINNDLNNELVKSSNIHNETSSKSKIIQTNNNIKVWDCDIATYNTLFRDSNELASMHSPSQLFSFSQDSTQNKHISGFQNKNIKNKLHDTVSLDFAFHGSQSQSANENSKKSLNNNSLGLNQTLTVDENMNNTVMSSTPFDKTYKESNNIDFNETESLGRQRDTTENVSNQSFTDSIGVNVIQCSTPTIEKRIYNETKAESNKTTKEPLQERNRQEFNLNREEIKDVTDNSDEDIIEELSESQAEIVPFKVIEELNKIKVYLSRRHRRESSGDSGYKSAHSRGSFSASQNAWLNQSAFCLFNFLSQCPLVVSTVDINHKISKVLGHLIDRLHEDENYPKFLEEMLEFLDKLLIDIYEGNFHEDNVFLKTDEQLDRMILFNKSNHIIKFTFEKIVQILDEFHGNMTNIPELSSTKQVENLNYIFHLLEILLRRYNTITSQSQSQSQQEVVLKRSTLMEIWRKKWNLSKTEVFQRTEEKKDVLLKCSEVLNKIIVDGMEGYSLVAFAALQCYNVLQSGTNK